MNNYKAFIQQLLSLANNSLQPLEQVILDYIITQVLEGLEIGSTCLNINNLDLKDTKENISLNDILNILERSNLVGYYNLKEDCLPIKPLTLMQIPFVDAKKNILYITRHFYYELEIAKKLAKLQVPSKVDKNLVENLLKALKNKIYSGFPNFEQLNAINTSLFNKLSIITGGPGTGKTTTVVLLLWVLIQLYDNLNIQVCAPTGKASARIKESIYNNILILSDSLGLDISFLQKKIDEINFGTIHKLLNYKINDIYFNYNANNPLNVDILIIDEISMVRADMLDNIDYFLRINRENPNPFGGVQVVFFGDLFQLPPVVNSNSPEMQLFQSYYESPYFFSARVMQEFEMDRMELQKVYRQENRHFLKLLEGVRLNRIELDDLMELNVRHEKEFIPQDFFIPLTSRNDRATTINQQEL
nr:AAA family ATPase [Burkholderiales bacterium]